MEREIFSKSAGVVALASTSISSATVTNGAWIDTLGFESLTVLLNITAYSGGNIGISFNGSNSAAGSHADSVAVSNDNTLYQPAIVTAPSVAVFVIGSVAKYRYVQLVLTTSNPTVSVTAAALALLSDAWSQPPVVNSSTLSLSEINGGTVEGDTNWTTPKR